MTQTPLETQFLKVKTDLMQKVQNLYASFFQKFEWSRDEDIENAENCTLYIDIEEFEGFANSKETNTFKYRISGNLMFRIVGKCRGKQGNLLLGSMVQKSKGKNEGLDLASTELYIKKDMATLKFIYSSEFLEQTAETPKSNIEEIE